MRVFTRWSERASPEETNELLSQLARKHRDNLIDLLDARFLYADSQEDGTLKSQILDVIPSSDASVLDWCSLDVSPLYHLCDQGWPNLGLLAEVLYHVSQIKAFYSKRQDLDLGVDKRTAALETFREAEVQCSLMNEAFRAWSKGLFKFDPFVEGVFHAAQRKIDRVLGKCPEVDELEGYFGPGATTQLPRRMACAKEKLSQPLACSGDMIPVLSSALGSLPHVLQLDEDEIAGNGHKTPKLVKLADREIDPEGIVTATVQIHGGKLVTVPKSWKTDRTVMVEPWLNSFFQLGVGRVISARLKSEGVDVRDQGKNKSLAREASLTGALATLDLSSASDSISVELVRHLLPADWYDLLSCLRTSMCEYGGEAFPLEKFSSMGNGFTFPLETLIFWALVSSVPGCSSVTSVYGDDIIVPTHAVPQVLKVLRSAGFSVNNEKSFWSGFFRESCGGDYYSGFDIRPFYVKDALQGCDVFRLHNQYLARNMPDYAALVESWIAPSLRLYGPQGYGDGHLHILDPLSHFYRTKRVRKSQWGGYLFDTYVWKKRKLCLSKPGDRILPHYSIYVSDVDGDRGPSSSGPREFIPDGSGGVIPVDFLPGTAGYKRVSIYILG